MILDDESGEGEFTNEDQQIAVTLGLQLALAYENAERLRPIVLHSEELEQRIQEQTVGD
jgi:hypothetical protein